MSMILEQVERIRDLATEVASMEVSQELFDAADTIENLSEKLHAANMERSSAHYNGGWIPTEERLPEEKINPITQDFVQYLCVFRCSDGREDVRTYPFGRGHWWNGAWYVDDNIAYWMPLPEPYHAEEGKSNAD